ncbi:TonB-dependent receptor [Mucilaginibacter sp. RS28]|uniref:TonB-dependent receptor n=1 Tax=Mucilaginibacter straminoryzae TaxID=2932774 RepID=A0A9X1X4U9_9SPHI|nr:TonB-dependent receptor [Mucilaginibacter straminoryzae]MCJ8210591.1 TonB-dependent receptor [Mucilaginibacter straminoryzae]
MKNFITATIALLLPFLASAQITLSGKVTEGKANNNLPGATVALLQGTTTTIGDVSKSDGSYEIRNIRPGSYVLKVTYVGYQAYTKSLQLKGSSTINITLEPETNDRNLSEVFVSATRASSKTPTTFTNLNRKDLQKNNLGQDLPYLLGQTPSAVTTSDAGAGVGYTGIRIRGSDGTRINVTINGIPYNDSESQGSYFVDLPDVVSSVDNIQIQRGVGTSTNGAGAFGASINIQTSRRRDTGYVELNNSAGSYGTLKNTINAGTGLIGGHFSVDGRLSRIQTDGYIDRAHANLRSYFVSGAYYGKGSTLRLNVFSGHEKTYQAWNGVNADSVAAGNRTYNELGYIAANGTYYNNQTDNYTQTHYQLLYDQRISNTLSFNGALHYTKGAGYYEEYKNKANLEDYGVTPTNPANNITDLIRRLWLDNDFYGLTYNFKYNPNNDFNLIFGGAYNQYKGAHFSRIMSTVLNTGVPNNYEYSRDNAKKNDFNSFLRGEYQLGKFLLYADAQYRHIYYSFLGFDRNLKNVQQAVDLNFFNPKAGVTFDLTDRSNLYASWAVGHREPNRDDYINSTPASRPKAETLHDFELGYRTRGSVFTGGINGFYMLYKNQLVLTGSLNDVGAAIRTNVPDSYRAGVELDGQVKITNQLTWAANAALSRNRVKDFHQFLFNYDNNKQVETVYKNSNIAFSPDFVGNSELSFRPIKNGEIAFISKYVSKQYLDNTSNINPAGIPAAGNNAYVSDRLLKAYFVNNLRLGYNFKAGVFKNVGITLLVNNLFNVEYIANGATYPDIEGGQVVNYNYFFPQAKRNFLASLNLKF